MLLGVVSGRKTDSIFWVDLIYWMSKNNVFFKPEIVNDASIGRNLIFQEARRLGQPLIMIDTDVVISTNDDIIKYIDEDFSKGYDVVVAPVLSHEGYPFFEPVKREDYASTEPYEVLRSSLSFVALSKRLVMNLKPMLADGKTTTDTFSTWFWKTPQSTEDIVFCEYVRKEGYKIAADPRIKVSHLSLIPLQFSPETMARLLAAEAKDQSTSK